MEEEKDEKDRIEDTNESNSSDKYSENNDKEDEYISIEDEYKKMTKELKHMNIDFDEFDFNHDFYQENFRKLKKINKIIDNLKISNLYNLTPLELLSKLVPENEFKNIQPIKILPNKWEDLFKLDISDETLNRLYISSKIQKVLKNYSDWKGESYQKWENKINEDNYKIYKKELKNYFNNHKNEILEKFEFMNLSEQELEDNFWFFHKNYEKLIKINNIINNIKFSNFYYLSPQQVLAKIVPENELKYIDSNEDIDDLNTNFSIFFDCEEEKKKLYKNAQICPEYILPVKWEDLFKFEISDKALDKLYLQSKIMKLAYEFSFIENESVEKWLCKINKDNYQYYEEKLEFNKKSGDSKYNKINNIIKELKSLEHFNKNEQEIKNNIKLYDKNINLCIKINSIIENAQIGDLYNITPSEAYKKITGDNPSFLNLPDKWEDLFNLEVPEWIIDILSATTKNNIKNKKYEENRIKENQKHEKEYKIFLEENKEKLEKEKEEKKKKEEIRKKEEKEMIERRKKEEKEKKEKRKKTIIKDIKKLKYFKITEKDIKNNLDYYIDNYEKLKEVNNAIGFAKKLGLYNKKPKKIYEKAFGEYETDNIFKYEEPENWEDLFSLKWGGYDLIGACKIVSRIEKIKNNSAKIDKKHNLDYYDSLINRFNFEDYENKYEKYKRIEELNAIYEYINKKSYLLKNDDYHEFLKYDKEYKELDLNYDSEIDEETLIKYENLFNKYKTIIKKIIKENAKKERKNDDNYSYNSNSNSPKYQKRENIRRIFLCRNCTLYCISCGKKGGCPSIKAHESCNKKYEKTST